MAERHAERYRRLGPIDLIVATLGLAAAALGAGGGLFALASSESDDITKLQSTVRAGLDLDYRTYSNRYDNEFGEWQRANISAWAMISVGVGAAAASITLFILDELEDEDPPIISPFWVPGGAGFSTTMSF